MSKQCVEQRAEHAALGGSQCWGWSMMMQCCLPLQFGVCWLECPESNCRVVELELVLPVCSPVSVGWLCWIQKVQEEKLSFSLDTAFGTAIVMDVLKHIGMVAWMSKMSFMTSDSRACRFKTVYFLQCHCEEGPLVELWPCRWWWCLKEGIEGVQGVR